MSDTMIVEPAPAKLNLALHVRRRRADGYHELETLFAFVTAGDTVRVERADAPSFAVTGPFAAALSGEGDNLVLRARNAFADRFGGGQNYAITLDKHLPVASGIGGGSADAAAALRGLARLNRIDPADAAMFECAALLGSDVPVCLLGRAARGGGRGEVLEPVDGWPGTPVLLVNPGVSVSTAQVFARWDGVDRGPLPPTEAFAEGRNDLQPAALAVAPVIGEVLERLGTAPGVTLSRMSGSGATCFALFDDFGARDRAAQRLAADRPDWWQLPSELA